MTAAATATRLAGPRRASVVLPGVPASVRRARAMVRRNLGDAETGQAAALCVSELAANAVAHTRSGRRGGTFTVTVELAGGGVLVRVVDGGSASAPTAAVAAAGAEHGRGLAIVAAVADAWGSEQDADGRRLTWFRIGDPAVTP